MSLSRRQKKTLKKDLKNFSLAQIAAHLGVTEKEILDYLQTRWRPEKFKKYLQKQKQAAASFKKELNFKKFFLKNRLVFAWLGFLCLAVYFNSFGHDFLSDDLPAIKNNPEINQISYFWYPPYFPIKLRGFLYFLIHQFFGLRPFFYRLSNWLSHLGTTWLIFPLLSLFFRAPVPFFSASFFAVHPILTESVTWISGGAYANGAFFGLLAFWFYLKTRENQEKKDYLFSWLAFTAAFSFSEKLIAFPLVLLAYELFLGDLKTHWPKLIPFSLLGGFRSIHLLGLVETRIQTLETSYYQESAPVNPFIQIPITLTTYLQLLVWPQKLSFYHSELVFSQSEYLLRLAIFLLLGAGLIFWLKKDRRLAFWGLFFLITLLPTILAFGMAWIVAERYVYLASLGPITLAAYALNQLGKKLPNKQIIYVFFGFILLTLSTRTIIRNNDWRNQDTLWLATAKTAPSSPQNHNNLGDLYTRQGNLEKAAEEFQIAIELKPNYGDAYHNLANVYQQEGQTDKAIENYQQALVFNPQLWQTHQNLAAIYFQQEDHQKAIEELEKALEINPQNPNLYLNLGIIYLKIDQKSQAKNNFQKTLELDPNNQTAKQWLISL